MSRDRQPSERSDSSSRGVQPDARQGDPSAAEQDSNVSVGSGSDESLGDRSQRPPASGPEAPSSRAKAPSSRAKAPSSRAKAPWMRLAGAGLELAFITIVFGAIGMAIDQRIGLERPVCSALSGLLGFVLGMIRFIRLATILTRDQR